MGFGVLGSGLSLTRIVVEVRVGLCDFGEALGLRGLGVSELRGLAEVWMLRVCGPGLGNAKGKTKVRGSVFRAWGLGCPIKGTRS